MRTTTAFFLSTLVSAVALMALAPPALAQRAGVTSKPLLRTSLSGDSTKESVLIAIEFSPGATTGRHSHPGDEYAAVLQGTLELRLEGQPPRRVTAGEAYHNPQGVVHETINVGETVAKTVATFVVEKNKPVVVPAP
ncbi:cupin domain-containing protein [Caenimonas sedimenti]|uniref:Cupin domain-containing protein n=1 Tax=Caenimonas sedimenti TaxID=2596921 RepID=A0A562ZR72_9BURK|nr:cupin domain-containing protein [Caenimonas sedimenti]TWO70654.1 cupin domain-containing protein [Caenimonas sedimenti]